MARQLYYQIRWNRSAEYQHIYIEVWPEEPNLYRRDRHNVTFSWQADRDHNYWYAFSIETKANGLERFQSIYKMTRRILRRNQEGTSPAEILDKLDRIGAIRVVYDRRMPHSESLVPVGELLPAGYKRYGDELNGARQTSVMAESRRDAQRKLSRALDESHYVSDSYLAKWLDAGRPVRVESNGEPPVVNEEESLLDITW